MQAGRFQKLIAVCGAVYDEVKSQIILQPFAHCYCSTHNGATKTCAMSFLLTVTVCAEIIRTSFFFAASVHIRPFLTVEAEM